MVNSGTKINIYIYFELEMTKMKNKNNGLKRLLHVIPFKNVLLLLFLCAPMPWFDRDAALVLFQCKYIERNLLRLVFLTPDGDIVVYQDTMWLHMD